VVDVDPFLTTLSVMTDDFCTTSWPLEPPPGPHAALTRSAVVTLAIFGPWPGFGSARGFYRDAPRHWRAAFPRLPTREQCNRQGRQEHEALGACLLHLVQLLAAQQCPYEALDSSGIPTRDAKRRGAGWLPGWADIGGSNRLGWYAGVHLRLAVNPMGVITGCGFGPASTKDHPLAETFCALRRYPHLGLPSVGPQPLGRTVSTKASRGKPIRWPGGGPLAPQSSARPSATVGPLGPSDFGAGGRGCATSSRPCRRSARLPAASIGNGPMISAGCRRAWPRRWRCITAACG